MRVLKTQTSHRGKIIVTTIAVGILVLFYFILAHAATWWPYQTKVNNLRTSVTHQSDNSKSSTPPPIGNKAKTNTSTSSENSNSNATTPSTQNAQVGISSASTSGNQMVVRAFIANVIEGSGTCTAIFTQDGSTVTESSPAFVDSSTSQCEPIQINLSRFTSGGSWSLVVTYKSPDTAGTSQMMKVNI